MILAAQWLVKLLATSSESSGLRRASCLAELSAHTQPTLKVSIHSLKEKAQRMHMGFNMRYLNETVEDGN